MSEFSLDESVNERIDECCQEPEHHYGMKNPVADIQLDFKIDAKPDDHQWSPGNQHQYIHSQKHYERFDVRPEEALACGSAATLSAAPSLSFLLVFIDGVDHGDEEKQHYYAGHDETTHNYCYGVVADSRHHGGPVFRCRLQSEDHSVAPCDGH